MILNCCSNDYANYSHNNAKALRSIGVECVDLVLSKHPFNYPTESKLSSLQEIIRAMQDADVVQVMHSEPTMFELAKNNCKGKVVVYHTGTRYRENHASLDILFKDTKTLTDQSEFFQLNLAMTYIVSPVELELAPLYNEGKVKVAHYPSNADVKGTDKILEMVEPFRDRMIWKCDTATVDHYFQLERMAKCDVYIELFKPELNGNPYGCFGVTGLEAAAMGKIVITNNLYQDVYRKAYGNAPMTIANNEWSFKNILNTLLGMDRSMIRSIQKESFEIMRDAHSFKATGERILKVINA